MIMKNSTKASLNTRILYRSVLLGFIFALVYVILERFFTGQKFEIKDMALSLVFDAYLAWPLGLALSIPSWKSSNKERPRTS